jgi:hypothetical protein
VGSKAAIPDVDTFQHDVSIPPYSGRRAPDFHHLIHDRRQRKLFVQAKSLAQNVQEKLKGLGATIYGVEGEREGEWVLVDLGNIVVHVMLPATRAYYNLEQLWGATSDRLQAASAA